LTREPTGTPEELLAQGVEHFNAGRFFQAHEAWETAWHPSASEERDFWQGITQIAVGFTHRIRGNPTGAVTLLRRGAERCSPFVPTHRGLDVGALVAQALAAADAIERDGADARFATPIAVLRQQ
jgi:predicted metal-dependent hydrolase